MSLGVLVAKENKVKVKFLSCVRLFVTSWTVAHQAPPSMEFSRQEYWRGLPFPSPGDLPHPGVEPGSPASWVQFSSVQSLSRVRLFATPWTVTPQAPLSMGLFQARILEWVAISISRGSSQPRDRTWVSCIDRRILYH